MSGHSKWSNIKRKKEKPTVKGQKFHKNRAEIAVAVKGRRGDPASNSKLKDCIAKAKANNVPNENIERIIKRRSAIQAPTTTKPYSTRATARAE